MGSTLQDRRLGLISPSAFFPICGAPFPPVEIERHDRPLVLVLLSVSFTSYGVRSPTLESERDDWSRSFVLVLLSALAVGYGARFPFVERMRQGPSG